MEFHRDIDRMPAITSAPAAQSFAFRSHEVESVLLAFP
jgi:hypothetical protein